MNSSAGTTSAGVVRRLQRRLRLTGVITAAVLLGIAAVTLLGAAGKPAPRGAQLRTARNFTLPALGHGGSQISLAAYAGRPVIINFFAPWCGPCQRETPLLASFYRAHQGRVVIIGIDSSDESGAARRFVASRNVTYPVAVDAFPAAVAASYGIINLPQTFVLNSKYQIVHRVSGGVTLRELTAWTSGTASGGPG
jgi:cytochrome c biogenesis protein CcmG/thiol:disulfide interchange protein DsbE